MSGPHLNFVSNILVVLVTDQLLRTLLLFNVVLAVCLVLRGRHVRLQLGLWALVCLSPLIPVQWQMPFSLTDVLGRILPQADLLVAMFQLMQLELMMLLSSPLVAGHPFVTWSMAIAAGWLAVAAVFVQRLFRARCRYWEAVSEGTLVSDAAGIQLLERVKQGFRINRPVALVTGTALASPFTIGTRRPVIFVPEQMLHSLDRRALLTLLAHEMAHIKRCDDLWGLLVGVIQRVFFFFPVFWFVGWQWRDLREVVCDGMAVRCGGQSAGDYAAGLCRIVHYFRQQASVAPQGPVPGLSLGRGGYRGRLLALRNCSLPCARESLLLLGGISLIVLFVMPVSSPNEASAALRERSREVLPTSLDKLSLPVSRERILAGFVDIPVNAPLGLGTMEFVHGGLDIQLPAGAEVVAMGPGRVIRVVDGPLDGISRRTGGYLSIRHDNGILTSYHYVGESPLRAGQRVAAGDYLGRLLADLYSARDFSRHGVEGPAPPSRLHISMHYRGIAIDPEQVIEFAAP